MARNNPYRLFLSTLREHWVIYTLGMLSMLITSFSEVMLPKFIQWAVELVTEKKEVPSFFQRSTSHETLDILVIFLLMSLVVGWIGRILWRQILARQSHRAGHRIKTKIWDTLKDQPLNLLDRHSFGDLMNRSTGDWNRTRFIHGFTIVMSFDLIFFSLLSTISMLLIDWKTTLLCLIIVPFLPWPIVKISKDEYKLHGVAQDQLSHLSDLISQSVTTVRLQRSTASEEIWLKRLTRYAEDYALKQFQVLKASWKIYVLASLPTLFSYAVLYSFGLYQIQSGQLSLGAFLALQSYVLLLQGPLFELGNNIAEWQTGFASYRRIAEIYDLKRDDKVIGGKRQIPSTNFAIKTQDLSIHFGEEIPAIRSLSLSIAKGERAGFMGPIGWGKSTLIHAIAGIHEGYEGQIQIFGADISQETRRWLTGQITMVPQKPFLFAGTIRSNLCLSEEKSDEELWKVLKAVELHGDLEQFPEGLESWIGEWGLNLSGGQKQRLAIARALLKPAPIIIFDDCLSAVDSVTEARILQNLDELIGERTVLWTAHRLSSLSLCDSIYQLDQGQMKTLRVSHENAAFSRSSDYAAQ